MMLTIRETMPDGVEQKTIKKIDHPGDVLERYSTDTKRRRWKTCRHSHGGLVGYFSYDYIKIRAKPKLKPLTKSRVEEGRKSGLPGHGPDAVRRSHRFRPLSGRRSLLITGVMTQRTSKSSYEASERVLRRTWRS